MAARLSVAETSLGRDDLDLSVVDRYSKVGSIRTFNRDCLRKVFSWNFYLDVESAVRHLDFGGESEAKHTLGRRSLRLQNAFAVNKNLDGVVVESFLKIDVHAGIIS